MVSCVVLDREVANAFSPLYQGDINAYADTRHFAYGTVMDGEPVGLFLSTVGEDWISVDWIYVKEEYRGKELGTRMVKGGARVIAEMFGEDFITVCCTDEKMKAFLEKCGFGFEKEPDRYSYRAKLSDMIELPRIKIEKNTVFALPELAPREYKALSLYFESLKDTEIGIGLPIRKEDYLDTPAVYIENDCIRALFLLKKESEEEISIAYAYAFGHDGHALFSVIQKAAAAVKEQFGEAVAISTASLGENTEKMLEKIFPGIQKTPIFFGYYQG